MNIAKVVIVVFLLLETLNVLTLYFAPGTKYGNGVGVFNAWDKSKLDPEIHHLVKYLVNWVAGTKLIFILLLIVIVLMADEEMLFFINIAMVVSIGSFFWRLFPLIRQMDQANEVTPKNYSRTLAWMIFAFMLIFTVPVIVSVFTVR
jgi:hypothetical protein